MKESTDNFKLYSLNQAKKLLGIGITTLEHLIGSGLIKTISMGKNRKKIPQQELQQYINQNLKGEIVQSLFSNCDKYDVNKFITGAKDTSECALDSVMLFNKIMENNYGKRI